MGPSPGGFRCPTRSRCRSRRITAGVVAATAGAVLVFRAQDGSLLWRHDLGSSPHGVPALGGEGIYVPVTDGRVIAFQADTGAMLWEHRLGARRE